jgi:hypothetical protein
VNSWSWTRRIDGSREQRAAGAELLRQCVLPDDAERAEVLSRLLERTTPGIVVALAEYHGVAGLAYDRLRQLEAPPAELMGPLRERYVGGVQSHLRVIWELTRLAPILDGTGARWAVIKGPAVVERLYPAPGLRPYFDLDLLVDPAAFGDVLEALQASGSRLLDRNWLMLRRELWGEVHLLLPGGTPLDLHWDLINMNRGRMAIDAQGVLDRTVRVDLGGVTVPTLDAADTVVHLAVHAALSGGDKLLWLKDVERAAAILDPPWSSVTERAHEWNVAAPAGLILGRARTTLDAAIPAEVPGQLLGSRATRLVGLVERISPWEQSVGRLTAASHVVSRTISQGPIGATSWLIRRAIHSLDPREPEASSAATPRGDLRDREAFVDAVIRSGAAQRSPR